MMIDYIVVRKSDLLEDIVEKEQEMESRQDCNDKIDYMIFWHNYSIVRYLKERFNVSEGEIDEYKGKYESQSRRHRAE